MEIAENLFGLGIGADRAQAICHRVRGVGITGEKIPRPGEFKCARRPFRLGQVIGHAGRKPPVTGKFFHPPAHPRQRFGRPVEVVIQKRQVAADIRLEALPLQPAFAKHKALLAFAGPVGGEHENDGLHVAGIKRQRHAPKAHRLVPVIRAPMRPRQPAVEPRVAFPALPIPIRRPDDLQISARLIELLHAVDRQMQLKQSPQAGPLGSWGQLRSASRSHPFIELLVC